MTFIISSTQQRFHHLGSAEVKVKEWERADLGEPETWMCQEIPSEYHSKLLSPHTSPNMSYDGRGSFANVQLRHCLIRHRVLTQHVKCHSHFLLKFFYLATIICSILQVGKQAVFLPEQEGT